MEAKRNFNSKIKSLERFRKKHDLHPQRGISVNLELTTKKNELLRLSGTLWAEAPKGAPDYGDWKNTHRRFCCWRGPGIREGLLARQSHSLRQEYRFL